MTRLRSQTIISNAAMLVAIATAAAAESRRRAAHADTQDDAQKAKPHT